MKMKSNKGGRLKNIYFKMKDYERPIELCSSFLLILAFVITLPRLAEIQIVWLASFITLAVGVNMEIKRVEWANPELKIEYEKNEFKQDIYDSIKEIRKEVKKLKDEKKKQQS